MNISNPPAKCAHAACKCEIPQERLAQNARHCSDWCAVETNITDECGCGHAACDVDLAQHPVGEESVMGLGPEGSGGT
jgi:hypothetical protein